MKPARREVLGIDGHFAMPGAVSLQQQVELLTPRAAPYLTLGTAVSTSACLAARL